MERIFELESVVKKYCRLFPALFQRAEGCTVFDTDGNPYLDFLSGAGALNYGHNNPKMTHRLLEYICNGNIVHGLDLNTVAKRDFLDKFYSIILEPRKLNYKVQFTGPTGANAVEAALKIARKVTNRKSIIHFYNSFHGLSLGALSVTSNPFFQRSSYALQSDAIALPFDHEDSGSSFGYIQAAIGSLSGKQIPAAIIVETIQAEGGINVASVQWLRRLEQIAKEFNIMLIVDDIQVGCGRTGTFFSFEDAGIEPDIVCLSKSLSGYGIPLSMLLLKPEIDVWEPGEHGGTFRANCLALVTGTAALAYWHTDEFSRSIKTKAELFQSRLSEIAESYSCHGLTARGRGLIGGLDFKLESYAHKVSMAVFDRGLLVETAGINNQVLKLLPPLTIDVAELKYGLDVIEDSILSILK